MHKRLLSLVLICLTGITFTTTAMAEEGKKLKAEDLVEKPVGDPDAADLGQIKRAKLTQEQAAAQLKYMMVQGWKRIEPDLLERGSFKPMGMTLSPEGEFRPVFVGNAEEVGSQEVALGAIVEILKEIAKSRTQWAVGLIYVTGSKNEDGTFEKRIVVTAEHIAGWAKAWGYPYALVDGEVKMARAVERDMAPVYFTQ